MRTVEEKKALIEISDIALAASLVVKGYKIHSLKGKGRYLVFYFKDDGRITNLIEAYYRDDLQVPAKRLFQEYKTLKQAKYAILKKGGQDGEELVEDSDTD